MTPADHAIDLLKRLAADLFAAHALRGEWHITDHADETAKADHDEALAVAALLEQMREAGLSDQSIRLDPHHAAARLVAANLTGAAQAFLHAIHKTGGWSAPIEHEHDIQCAIDALQAAVVESLLLPAIPTQEN